MRGWRGGGGRRTGLNTPAVVLEQWLSERRSTVLQRLLNLCTVLWSCFKQYLTILSSLIGYKLLFKCTHYVCNHSVGMIFHGNNNKSVRDWNVFHKFCRVLAFNPAATRSVGIVGIIIQTYFTAVSYFCSTLFTSSGTLLSTLCLGALSV